MIITCSDLLTEGCCLLSQILPRQWWDWRSRRLKRVQTLAAADGMTPLCTCCVDRVSCLMTGQFLIHPEHLWMTCCKDSSTFWMYCEVVPSINSGDTRFGEARDCGTRSLSRTSKQRTLPTWVIYASSIVTLWRSIF